MAIFSIDKLTDEARRLAVEYRNATGKTLPVTAEIAINDAIKLLNLGKNDTGEAGYDAVYKTADDDFKVQIKGRAIFKPQGGYRIGQLKMDQKWDAIVLVIMNDQFESEEIYLCHRDQINEHLQDNESNRKGAMTVARFRIIGTLVWSKANGLEDDGYWSNRK